MMQHIYNEAQQYAEYRRHYERKGGPSEAARFFFYREAGCAAGKVKQA